MLILRQPRTSQPQQAAGVDWGNPLTRGLVLAYDGQTLSNAALMRPMGRTGTVLRQLNAKRVRGFGANGLGASDAVNSNFNGQSAPITIWTRYFRTGGGGNGVGRVFQRAGADLMLQSSGVVDYYRTFSGGTGIWSFGTGTDRGTDANTEYTIAVVSSGVASDVPAGYVNGLPISLSTIAGTSGTPSFGTSNYFIGNEPGLSRNWDGLIGEFLVWHRLLSAVEIAELQRNVWQLFAPEPRRIWVPSGAGGVSGTVATTNANDTLNASGTPIIVGTSARTNANDTSTASGTPIIVGTLARTNANDTSSASGGVGATSVSGTSATTNANDTSTASGSPVVNGTSATTNANDAPSAQGWAGVVSGTAAVTNRNDVAAAFGDAGPARRDLGAGRSRKRRRYTVEIDGQEYDVTSPAEAEAILKAKAEKAAQEAIERAQRAERRPGRKVLADARKALALPTVTLPDTAPADLTAGINASLEGIRELYESTLRTIEIAALLRKQRQDEEDEEEVLLMLL